MDQYDPELGGRPLNQEHFTALASIHGLHAIPEGKGHVHYMILGGWVRLDGKYDSWVPLQDEPLSDQIRRVTLTERERERRESVRLEHVEIYKRSPLYSARAEEDPSYWDNFHPGGLL